MLSSDIIKVVLIATEELTGHIGKGTAILIRAHCNKALNVIKGVDVREQGVKLDSDQELIADTVATALGKYDSISGEYVELSLHSAISNNITALAHSYMILGLEDIVTLSIINEYARRKDRMTPPNLRAVNLLLSIMATYYGHVAKQVEME